MTGVQRIAGASFGQRLAVLTVLLVFATQPPLQAGGPRPKPAIPLPAPGHRYAGVYPGTPTGAEDDLRPQDLDDYETAAGKPAAWVTFSHNWFRQRQFPLATAAWIRARGSIPHLRLMLRSDLDVNHADPLFTLDRLNQGQFDPDLAAWFVAARAFQSPLLVEFGTEVNERSFPWNGVWNGERRGPAQFRRAYRHIIGLARAQGATNITWVFHLNSDDNPKTPWNRFENYYPGDAWIDWIGVSVYGAQEPGSPHWPAFRSSLDRIYGRLTRFAPNKPIFVLEFGATDGSTAGNQAQWADSALADLVGGRWPRIRGFSWWNERWQVDGDPSHDSRMRVQDNPALAAVFQARVGGDRRVLGRVAGGRP